MKIKVPPHIASITPYPQGKPLEELERQYGIKNAVKIASNENPWGPSPKAVRAIRAELLNLHRYPDASCHTLTMALAKKFGLDSSEIILGNGSNEVIDLLVKALVTEGDEVITSHPSFLMYQKFVQARGGVNHVVPLKEMKHDLTIIRKTVSEKTRLIFLDNPNNPTGTAIAPVDLYHFLSDIHESIVVVLDEAYIDFMDPKLRVDVFSLIRNAEGRCPVVFLRTFSKVYGLAGLRIGFGLMSRQIADILQRVRQPFNINQMAQVGALAALADEEHYLNTVSRTRSGMDFLQAEVAKIGCHPYPSHTNFFLIDVGGSADALYEALLVKGIIVRSMSAYGFAEFIRVTVGTDEENGLFLKTLAECLNELHYV